MGNKNTIINVLIFLFTLAYYVTSMTTTGNVKFINAEHLGVLDTYEGVKSKSQIMEAKNNQKIVTPSPTALPESEIVNPIAETATSINGNVAEQNAKASAEQIHATSTAAIRKQTPYLEPILPPPTPTVEDGPITISIFGEVVQPRQKEIDANQDAARESEGDNGDIEIESDTEQFVPIIGNSVTFYILFTLGTFALILQLVLFKMSTKGKIMKHNAKCV